MNTGMCGLLEYSRSFLLRGFADSAYGVPVVFLTHRKFLFKFYILAFTKISMRRIGSRDFSWGATMTY